MSLSILDAKPEDLDTAEKRGKYTTCIVGCGQVGILHAVLFAEAGFKVVCVDVDQIVVNNVAKGRALFSGSEIESKMKSYVKSGRLTATNDIKKAVSQSDIIAVTVPARVDARKKVDYSNIESICKRIGPSLRLKSLVIMIKLAGIGVIEGTLKETLENSSGFKVGTGFGLAYSPFLTLADQGLETATNQRRIVAATDTNSLKMASAVLGSITKGGLRKTGNMKVAEAAALFEVQQQDVRVAFANEVALFSEKLGIDYPEVLELLKGVSDSTLTSPELSGGKVREEPYLLLAEVENIDLKLRIPAIAREVNEQTKKHVVNLVKDALRSCGKTLRRARVSMLGISETPNMRSSPKRIVKEIAQLLTAKGARITLYDPYFSENELTDMQFRFKRNFTEAVENADCIIILTAHDQFKRLSLNKLKIIMRRPGAIVDLEGIIEPGKVEKEGFIYRGLGRGVWTK